MLLLLYVHRQVRNNVCVKNSIVPYQLCTIPTYYHVIMYICEFSTLIFQPNHPQKIRVIHKTALVYRIRINVSNRQV